MESVARPLPPTTAASLASAGVRIAIVSEGLTAPRVDVVAPAGTGQALREALAWRIAAMVDARRAALRTETRPWALPTPVAVPGVRAARTGACPSCGDLHADRALTGDCDLCAAARIAALRQLGAIGPASPVAPPVHHRGSWHALMERPRPQGVVLPAQPHAPWTCAKCSTLIERLPVDPDMECGPCQIRRQSVVDTSRLGGRHA